MPDPITYTRHELHHPDEPRAAPLEVFLYDVPHVGACGVFPPLHILNQILRSGGGTGGMSPGATWEPFELTGDEYAALLPRILDPDLELLRAQCRFGRVPWRRDPTLDHIEDRFEWLAAACDKHRQAHLRAFYPDEPTLFVSVFAPDDDRSVEIAELPLEAKQTSVVMGNDLPHPPAMKILEQTELALVDGVVIKLQAHVELEGCSYGVNVQHDGELVLQAGGHYARPDGQHGGLYGPDLNVRLPTGHLLGLRIFGPPDRRAQRPKTPSKRTTP